MLDWAAFETVIRRDPAGRGLASCNENGALLLVGHLQQAALELAEARGWVAIVTGFAIRTDGGPVAETDGPPGTIFLAAMLRACGIDASILTDRVAEPVLRAGLDSMQLSDVPLLVAPSSKNDETGCGAVRDWWLSVTAKKSSPSQLVAVERVGPSHTLDSVEAEFRDAFEKTVPSHDRDVCHNMRGISLDDCTAPLHVLFETDDPAASPQPRTIGIVDGGNEIGCGNISWDVLRRSVAQGSGATIACRIPTNHTILTGVSNWGAYALGAAVFGLRGQGDVLANWTAERQQGLIEAIVAQGGAVDGVTKRREPTVDGLPITEEMAVFQAVRSLTLR